jgi:hypothetical protein
VSHDEILYHKTSDGACLTIFDDGHKQWATVNLGGYIVRFEMNRIEINEKLRLFLDDQEWKRSLELIDNEAKKLLHKLEVAERESRRSFAVKGEFTCESDTKTKGTT